VGSDAERRALIARMSVLGAEGLVVVDNGADPPGGDDPRVLHAPRRPSSYYARNAGARRGRAEWIVFLDDDTAPDADLLERYFIPPPDERTAVLAGEVRDEAPEDIASLPLAARFAALRAPMDQSNTLGHGKWAYAQTANVAVRRAAFEAVGGFQETVRSGGDADLCFRLKEAGWGLEERPFAIAGHRNRTTLRALARQRARHGAGAAWLDALYPGSFPGDHGPRRIVRSCRQLARAVADRLRGDRDAATVGFVGLVFHWSFELGRLFSNDVEERPR
jgi:GT2 family glycosyltransferase